MLPRTLCLLHPLHKPSSRSELSNSLFELVRRSWRFCHCRWGKIIRLPLLDLKIRVRSRSIEREKDEGQGESVDRGFTGKTRGSFFLPVQENIPYFV